MFAKDRNETSRFYSLDLKFCVENLEILGHLGIGLSLCEVANTTLAPALIPFSASPPLFENFKFIFLFFLPSLISNVSKSFHLRPNPHIAYPAFSSDVDANTFAIPLVQSKI